MPGMIRNPAPLFTGTLLLFCMALTPLTQAQEDSFLRCASYSDRTERVLCLEDALDAAVAARNTSAAPPQAAATAAMPIPPAPAAPIAPAAEAHPELPTGDDAGLIDKAVGWFARENDIAEGNGPAIAETMKATVRELEFFKPEIRTITFDNGQVWRQLYAGRYNLRVGDTITITRTSGRVQYRLEADRFNGFIQVKRLR